MWKARGCRVFLDSSKALGRSKGLGVQGGWYLVGPKLDAALGWGQSIQVEVQVASDRGSDRRPHDLTGASSGFLPRYDSSQWSNGLKCEPHQGTAPRGRFLGSSRPLQTSTTIRLSFTFKAFEDLMRPSSVLNHLRPKSARGSCTSKDPLSCPFASDCFHMPSTLSPTSDCQGQVAPRQRHLCRVSPSSQLSSSLLVNPFWITHSHCLYSLFC